jgi:hypothetical protein
VDLAVNKWVFGHYSTKDKVVMVNWGLVDCWGMRLEQHQCEFLMCGWDKWQTQQV